MSKTLEQIKIQAVVEATAANGFNQVKAAQALDISRGTLRNLLAKYTGGRLTKTAVVKKYLSSNTI